MAEPDPRATNAPAITVSELSSALKRAIEDRFGYVRVRGEISGYRGPHSSGHAYFSLKDANARLDAVIWRSALQRMRVKPEEGLEVVATGKLTTFPGKSRYQIVIEALELAGVGALMALLEARRRKLAEEGLFDSARKRKVPFLPKVVGVVTSPTGAVIRDILHRLADRFPVRVVVWPVRVQGETSAAEVAAAIDGFNALTRGRRAAAAGRPDRRARRRLARGSHELQRRERGARRRSQRDPADRRDRPRDRLDADRPRGGFARADADRGGRIRRARSRRAHRLARGPRRRGRGARSCASPSGCAAISGRSPARCREARPSSPGPRQRLDRAAESLRTRARAALDQRALRAAGLARRLARHSPRAFVAGRRERLRGLIGRHARLGPILIERLRRAADAAARAFAREAALQRGGGGERAEALAGSRRAWCALSPNACRTGARSLSPPGNCSARSAIAACSSRGFALVRDEGSRRCAARLRSAPLRLDNRIRRRPRGGGRQGRRAASRVEPRRAGPTVRAAEARPVAQ